MCSNSALIVHPQYKVLHKIYMVVLVLMIVIIVLPMIELPLNIGSSGKHSHY